MSMKEMSDKRIKEVADFIMEHDADKACEKFGLKSIETAFRYKREAEARGMLPDEKVVIQGLKPVDYIDVEEKVLPYLKEISDSAKQKNILEKNQVIDVGAEPCMIVLISDVHFGGKIDVDAMLYDMDIIRSHPRVFVILAGDMFDNFIVGKLQGVQKNQPTTHAMELKMVEWYLNKIKYKIIAMVSGNHDDWNYELTGRDFLKDLTHGWKMIYSRHEAVFSLKCGDINQVWKVRHKFKYNSLFNLTHGQEVDWERGGVDFDVAVGGHKHNAAAIRPFIRHDKKRYAVALGTYKIRDEFARKCGFPPCHGNSAAFILHPDGRMLTVDGDVSVGLDLLNAWEVRK